MIDYTKGFDDELNAEEEATENLIEMPKVKRAPFVVWRVGDTDYRLKLTAADISKLEQRYRRNLLMYLMDDGIPAVADMLTVIQAAMRSYEHGMTFLKVQNLFDEYVSEGGDQNALLADVLMPLLSVSGFFTQSQAEMLTQELKNLDTNV